MEAGFSEEEGRSETDGAVTAVDGGRRRGREKNEEEEGQRERASDERVGERRERQREREVGEGSEEEEENGKMKGRECLVQCLQGELLIICSSNLPQCTLLILKPLKPASNLLNLQNILGFTIPSYFKLFNFLINYMHIYYSKFSKCPQKSPKIPKNSKILNFSIYYFPKHSLILY